MRLQWLLTVGAAVRFWRGVLPATLVSIGLVMEVLFSLRSGRRIRSMSLTQPLRDRGPQSWCSNSNGGYNKLSSERPQESSSEHVSFVRVTASGTE